MTEMAIRTDGLSRSFGSLRAVDGLSLQVPRGSVFGFLGPNGSGKTTTIRLLLGLLEPTGGRAEVLGFDVRTQPGRIRERAGALLEHPGIYEHLSAEDNLEFYGRAWRMPEDKRRARIRELLEHMGLWDRRNDKAGNWSRGMKQKLAVARAILHRPTLVFLDEPTAGLDPVAAAALREDIAALARREGATVFLTTHNLSEAEKLCSLVAVIRRGRLLVVASPEQLRRESATPQLEVTGHGFSRDVIKLLEVNPEVQSVTVLGGQMVVALRSEDVAVSRLVRTLVDAGAEVEEIRRTRPSLEETFLALVEDESRGEAQGGEDDR